MQVKNSVVIGPVIENLSAEQLGQLIDKIVDEIKQIEDDLEEDKKPHRRLYTSRERERKKDIAVACYQTYLKVYAAWELKIKQERPRNWSDPILKKYKDLGIIR
jgi:hypothetical protein